jgi:GcrA cell cycle regulator
MANQWGGQSGTPDMLKAPMMPDAFDASADTPPGRRVRLMDLGRANCRWPIGHPGAADFGFCNRRRIDGGPYCAAHAERAFKVAPGGKA